MPPFYSVFRMPRSILRLRISLLTITYLLVGGVCSFGSELKITDNQTEDDLNEANELINIVKNYLFENLDSANVYLRLLDKNTTGTSLRGDYLNLASTYHYYLNNWDSSIHFAKLYYDYGIETEDLKISTDGTKKLMLLYESSGDMETSDMYMNQLVEVIPNLEDRDQLAKIYNALGARATNANRFTPAINYYLQIDSLYAVDDAKTRSRAIALENIGSLYANLPDSILTLEYYNRSKKMYEDINDKEGVNSISIQLGNHYYRNGNIETALETFLSCESYFEAYQNERHLVILYQGIMLCYMDIGELDIAASYQQKLGEIIKKELAVDKTSFNVYSGKLFHLKKNYKKAIDFYLKGINASSEKTFIYEGLEGLTKSYEAIGDYKNAYKYATLKSITKDSLNKLRNYQSFQNLETEYKTKQKEEEIRLLSTQNELSEQRHKSLSIIYIITISFVILLASLLYFLYRNRKKVAHQLNLLDKMKNKFFTNISHEFRTPLTIIGGLTNQILKSPNFDSVHFSSLQTIKGNVDRLAVLTNQLIDLNKIDANKVEVNFVSGDIHAYLKKYASLFKSYVTSQQKELILSIPEEPLIMDFDEDKLQSVLYNLLHNAIKHSENHGQIEIRASRVRDNFCLEIIDNGEGIDPKIISQIFDRFYSTSEQGALGSGVGLAYVKELIHLCKGEITVISKLHYGSTFKIILPILHNSKSKASLDIELPVKITNPNSTLSRINSYGNLHMLIAEDNSDISRYLQLLLQDDFLVTTVKNGEDALEVIETETVDFILSDVMMPKMDGFDFCRKIKNNSDFSHIPFILITAKTSAEDRRKGRELGADGYLTKPFDEEELLALISNLLKKRNEKINWFTEVLELKSSLKAEELIRQEDLDFIKKLQSSILRNTISYGVAELSNDMGMSSKIMRNKVQALTGRAINKYSNHIRIEKSKQLLKNTDYTISQIAIEVGYEDAAYFSRVFKKHEQISPKNFRDGM